MNWNKTSEVLPKARSVEEFQINVLMYSPEWACAIPGIFTDLTVIGNPSGDWMMHDTGRDKFLDTPAPEYWFEIKLP